MLLSLLLSKYGCDWTKDVVNQSLQSSLTGDRLQLDFIGEVQTGGQLCRGVGQPCADHSDVDRLARRLPLHRQKGRLVDGGRQLLGVDGGVGSGVGVGHVDVRDAAVGAYGLDGECSRVHYYSAVGALVPTVELLRRRRRVLFIKGKIMPRDTTISA